MSPESSNKAISVPPRTVPGDLNLVHHIAESANVVMNVRTDYVVTTRDKIEIALRRKLPEFLGRSAWVAPLTLLIGLIAAIITSDFQDFMGVDDEVWSTVFVVGAVLAGVWLIRSFVQFFKSAKMEDVLDAIVATHDVNDRQPLQGVAWSGPDDRTT
ncbi:hypothetical protein [Paenarthrobacter sp. NPDC089316]|uniref:hypothetical protein n=1 Tax=unclassified Paenarthrobacter TaxID=2634190 RepID=UPI00342B0895